MDDPIIFPEEILLEIFTRLPAKSVGKCRCLSKTWNTQLSTKNFINSHLTQLKTHQGQEKQLIVIHSESLHIFTNPLETEEEEQVLSREIPSETIWEFVLGSSNGLVLLLEKETCDLFVSNPITRQQVKVPKHPGTLGYYGFGYEPSCDDYEVVTLYYKINETCAFVDVCSLKKKVWKRVCELPSDSVPPSFIMPFVNGNLHWLTRDAIGWKYRLYAMHLANETIHQLPYPEGLECPLITLVIFKGYLGILDFAESGYFDVWVMKEYGVAESWVRLRFDINIMIEKEMKPVCSIGNHNQILLVSRDFFVACGLENKIILSGLGHYYWSVFVETLISPKQENVASLSVGTLENGS